MFHLPFLSRPRAAATVIDRAPAFAVVDDTPAATLAEQRAAVEAATRIIQAHLDREAANRNLPGIQPRQLCPDQKIELVAELRRALG